MTQAQDLDDFGNSRCGLTGLNLVDQAVLEMILKLNSADAVECTADGCDLLDDLDAIRIVLDELDDAVDVAASRFQAIENGRFLLQRQTALLLHMSTVPTPHGVETGLRLSDRTEGSGGGFLDEGSAFGLYSRLDLFAAGKRAAAISTAARGAD